MMLGQKNVYKIAYSYCAASMRTARFPGLSAGVRTLSGSLSLVSARSQLVSAGCRPSRIPGFQEPAAYLFWTGGDLIWSWCILHHFTSFKFWMESIFYLGPYQKPYFSAHALFLTLDKICKIPSIRNARLNVMKLMDLWSNRF